MGNMELGHGPEGSGPEGGSRRVDPASIPQRVVNAGYDANGFKRGDREFLAAALDALMTDEPVWVERTVSTFNAAVRPCDVLAAVLERSKET